MTTHRRTDLRVPFQSRQDTILFHPDKAANALAAIQQGLTSPISNVNRRVASNVNKDSCKTGPALHLEKLLTFFCSF